MSEVLYDIPINEVAQILDKSDRQVRRYVKERRLKARPIRIDGHIKLMFSRDEVVAFKDKFTAEGMFGETGREIIVDAQLIDNDVQSPEPPPSAVSESAVIDTPPAESAAVKYAIDALKDQITHLQQENRDLHYELEKRSGMVGFWQAKAETLQEEVKALMPIPKPEEEAPAKRPWWKLFG